MQVPVNEDMTTSSPLKPNYPGPHSYLILVVVFTVLCVGVYTSLACSLPAITFAILVLLIIKFLSYNNIEFDISYIFTEQNIQE